MSLAGHMIGRIRDEQKHAAARAARAQLIAARLARRLKDHTRVREVYLYGSMVWDQPAPTADLDLAVVGLSPAEIIEAATELDNDAAPFQLDLTSLERLPEKLRERVLREGERLL